MRQGRVSSPAARFTIWSAPARICASMISSKTAVRTIIAQAIWRPRFIELTIASPFSPARRAAKGSRKIASGRAVSMAR
jgi:hypothetical protein